MVYWVSMPAEEGLLGAVPAWHCAAMASHLFTSRCAQAYGGKAGLLQLKEDKYSGDQVVVGVDRGHDLLWEFRWVGYQAQGCAWADRNKLLTGGYCAARHDNGERGGETAVGEGAEGKGPGQW